MSISREIPAALIQRGVVAILSTLCMVAFSGTSRADEDQDAPPARTRPASLKFKVVRSDDGRPVAEAKVGVRLYGDKQNINREIVTDAEGVATFEYPDGDQPTYLWALVTHAGLVPYYVNFGRNLVPAALPTEKIIRIDAGKTIGGKVVGQDGKPVAKAQLSILVPATDTPDEIHYHLYYEQTAADGTWQFDGAPLKLAGLHLRIEHPGFIQSSHSLQDRTDGRYELDPGLQLTGRVVDQAGKPVVGAKITVGRDRWGRNIRPTPVDEQGAYTVSALSPEATAVTVEAQGFAPQVKSVVVEKATKPVDFELEPGRTTRFQVVDIAGKPLIGIRIVADTWNGYRSLWWQETTDADGLATWTGAPADAVEFHLVSQGYAARRDVVVAAQEEPHIVVLQQPLKIEGTVTGPDKQKVPEFQVKLGWKYDGRDEILWSRGSVGRNGKFEIEEHETYKEVFVRIEAKGLKPWTSTAIPFSDGQRKLFIRLDGGAGPAGTVRLSDGQPAVGAQVVLFSINTPIQLEGGLRARGGKQTVVADEDGRFEFTPVNEAYSLIAFHDGGYAEISDQDLAKSKSIDLQPWAKVEVTVQRAGKPLAGAKVVVNPRQRQEQRIRIYSYGLAGTTNDEGRVTFDRVPPQTVNVTLPLEQSLGRNSRVYSERGATASLTPGNTTQVTLGGTGAAVTGKLAMTGKPPAEHRWEFNDAITMTTARAQNPLKAEASDYYRALIANDGSFRIDDLPPGRYELQVSLTSVSDAIGVDQSAHLGRITHNFQVGANQTEVNLGVIEGTWQKLFGAGEQGPLFVAEGLNCPTIRLSELRGRLVLLDYWESKSTSWIAELPQLEKLHQEFAKESRFQLVGLSTDTRLTSAQTAVKQRDLPWTCAFAGQRGLPALRYEVKISPERFLLDIDGKILYRGRDLDVIGKLIKQRLAELPEKIAPPGDPVGIVPTKVEDDFAGTTPIAVASVGDFMQTPAGNPRSRTKSEATLWSEDGKPIRTLAGLGPQSWLAQSSQMAFDAKRDRSYFWNSSKQLVALNRVGRRLFVCDVPDLHAVAVDEQTGDVWCLALQGLFNGELVILDSNGREKTRHPIAGFDIAYSPADDAFWVAGSGILKVNRNGEVVSRHPLPQGVTTFAGISVDRNRGGAWLLEVGRENTERQLWKVAPDGTASSVHQFPSQTYPTGVACIDGSAWVTVFQRDATAPPGTNRGQREIQRFTADGKPADPLPIPAVEITVSPQTGTIWVSDGEQLFKVDRDGKTLLTIPLDGKSMGVRLGAF